MKTTKKIPSFRRITRIHIVLLAVILALSMFLIKNNQQKSKGLPEVPFLAKHPEYQYAQLSLYFQKLADSKGPEYAFNLLRVAKLPPNTDIHLLGHIVGDVLYKKEGANGMALCTNEFRNACSHSIVTGLFTDYGEKALDMIAQACYKAPGGKGAYTMCFHGLGHGVLAQYGYAVSKTVAECLKTSTADNQYREGSECVGGAIMEIVGGGFHDRELWEKQRKIYLSNDDLLYPCDSDTIPKDAKPLCYLYITPHLLGSDATNSATIQDSQVKQAFASCGRIPAQELVNRDYCFGGIIKEVIVVTSNDRDIRTVEHMTDEQLQKVYAACLMAGVDDGINSCIRHTINTLYWGGENTPEVSVRFCSLISSESQKSICFTHLTGAINFYIQDRQSLASLCKSLPQSYYEACYGPK